MRIDTPLDWRSVVDRFLHDADRDPTWRTLVGTATIVVHGSTTVGLADHYSDIDLQIIVTDHLYTEIHRSAVAAGRIQPSERLVLLRSRSTTSDGRRALCAAELRPLGDLQATLDAELPVELWVMTHARIIQDPGDRVATILATATRRFADQLEALTATELGHLTRRRRWLAIACQRHDHHASRAFLATNFVRAAMRLACLLDDSPIPYDKWLVAWAARNTRLGAKLHHPCLDLLLCHTDPTGIGPISATIVDATLTAVRHRWPHAGWITHPTHFGAVRS